MAYTMAQFARLDLLADAAVLSTDMQARCVKCNCELRENITGYRASGDGVRCSDCYYDALSAIIDASPIGAPGRR